MGRPLRLTSADMVSYVLNWANVRRMLGTMPPWPGDQEAVRVEGPWRVD